LRGFPHPSPPGRSVAALFKAGQPFNDSKIQSGAVATLAHPRFAPATMLAMNVTLAASTVECAKDVVTVESASRVPQQKPVWRLAERPVNTAKMIKARFGGLYQHLDLFVIIGSDGRDRTYDQLINSQLLYR
jgi:hypothetical protein